MTVEPRDSTVRDVAIAMVDEMLATLEPHTHVVDVEISMDLVVAPAGAAPRDGHVRRRAAGALAAEGVGYPPGGHRAAARGGVTAGGGASPPCTGSGFPELDEALAGVKVP